MAPPASTRISEWCRVQGVQSTGEQSTGGAEYRGCPAQGEQGTRGAEYRGAEYRINIKKRSDVAYPKHEGPGVDAGDRDDEPRRGHAPLQEPGQPRGHGWIVQGANTRLRDLVVGRCPLPANSLQSSEGDAMGAPFVLLQDSRAAATAAGHDGVGLTSPGLGPEALPVVLISRNVVILRFVGLG